MKIVYKKSIVDQLLDAKAEALLENKEIDYIILTDKEWMQLRRETGYYSLYGVGIPDIFKRGRAQFDGMTIYREDE